jgi:hypothetical protein
MYSNGPSARARLRASSANTTASVTHPNTVMAHAIKALSPNGARDAGCMKIPMPIVLPTTSAVHIQNPSCPLRGTWLCPSGCSIASVTFIVARPRLCCATYFLGEQRMSRVAVLLSLLLSLLGSLTASGAEPRARDLGVPFDGVPGPLNAITDVRGVPLARSR